MKTRKLSTMEKLNEIWRQHTRKDLTEEEAWKMVDLVKCILENADHNFTEASK